MSSTDKRGGPGTRIGFFLPDLNGGGAERMTLNLMPALAALGYAPFLVVGCRRGSLWPAVPPGTDVVCLESESWSGMLLGLQRLLRARRPDVLIASMGRCNMLALWARALTGVKTRIVIREHVVISALAALAGGRAAFTPLFYRLFAKWADAIVAVSDGVADDMARLAHVPRTQVQVIYNPVLTPLFETQLAGDVDHPFFAPDGPPVFLGVGRFEPQKDFATLIRAFALLRQSRPGKLLLIGEGTLRAELEVLCRRLNIESDVAFLGFREDRLLYMRRASVFVLPSLMEGFSNVVVEALAAGTQVVSTDCPSGPRFVLEDGRYGTLVPVGDAAAMARAMGDAVDNPRPMDEGRRRALAFTAARAAKKYAKLIEDIGAR